MQTKADIQGVRPRVEVRPAAAEQLAAVLALANQEGLAVCVAGGGTKLGWGNPPERFDVLLGVGDIARRCHVDADDLTMTASASTTVGEARAAARAQGRVLPLDARQPARATLGGAVATADQGPRGAGFGGVRDVVLGLRATLADGSTVSFGGRTMKNVAGYDMTKLFVGSFGTLGVLTELTIRLLPQPDTEAILLLSLDTLARGREIAARVLDSQLTPWALVCLSPGPARAMGGRVAAASSAGASGSVLAAGFAGHGAAVARSISEVRALRPDLWADVLEKTEVEPIYDALTAFGRPDPTRGEGYAGETFVVTLRATVPISRVWDVVGDVTGLLPAGEHGAEFVIDAARGVVNLRAVATSTASSVLGRLRESAAGLDGYVVVTAGLQSLGSGFDAWGRPVAGGAIMGRLKEQFDPRGTLNPGRLARWK